VNPVWGVLIAALWVWAVWLFNRLVRDRNRVLAAWSDIDVQLKRRHDLIPKLVDAVRQYAAYEQSTLNALTELRARSEADGGAATRGPIEHELSAGLRRLIAVAENYPELKANANFLDLQQQLSTVETDIQYARRYYNGAVRNLNTRIDSFPDLIIARLFGYRYADYFQLEEDEAGAA
jgi:LemA protein